MILVPVGMSTMVEGDTGGIWTFGPLATVLYFLFPFVDGYDTQILPVCMRAFEVSLELSPSSLSVFASAEFMAMLGFSPIWGLLVDGYAHDKRSYRGSKINVRDVVFMTRDE